MDPFYRVPLTSGEALATLAALRFLRARLEAADDIPEIEPEILDSAAARIAAEVPDFYPDRARALAEALSRSVAAAVPAEEADRETPPFPVARTRRLLEDAFERDAPVEIEYYVASRDEWTTRVIHIENLYKNNDAWYLSGHCGLRDDTRLFRLDHIRSVRLRED